MERQSDSSRVFRFGSFELDRATGELRKGGVRVKLQEQPFQVLAALLARPGELVTRDELHEKLWPGGTHVEFDQNLNAVVKKVRRALGDSSETPRFIETLPKKGYRFAAPVDLRGADDVARPSRAGRYITAAAIGVVVIAIAWFAATSLSPHEELSEPGRPIPLTSYPGEERWPSFSPDGERVVFAWNGEDQDNWDLYLKGLGTQTPVQLTHSTDPDYHPRWSPDGRWIAFLRASGQPVPIFHGAVDLMLIPAVGGSERRLTEIRIGSGHGHYFDWLPNSQGLVVAHKSAPDSPQALFRLSLTSEGMDQVTSPPLNAFGDFGPAFSPERNYLAFVRQERQSLGDLYVLEVDENFAPRGEPRRLTFEHTHLSDPAWLPGGREVMVGLDAYLNPELRRISIGGSGQLSRVGITGAQEPALSKQKNRLAYSRLSGASDIELLHRGDSSGAAWAPAKFPSSTRSEFQCRYSPDGRKLVFQSDRTGTSGIWVSAADGSSPTLIYAKEGAFSGSPRWSHDGERVVFDSNSEGNQNIYVISASGGQALRLTKDPADEIRPSWSLDGKWIYYTSDRTGRWEIWKSTATGGEAIQVTHNGGSDPQESPDSRFVYYVRENRRRGALLRMPVAGGTEERVTEGIWSNAFHVTNSGVYFIYASGRNDLEQGYSLRFLKDGSGEAQVLAKLQPRPYFGLSVSPDEGSIVYSSYGVVGGDLMLIENFR